MTSKIPERTVEINPTIVKILADGTPVVSYYWEGAEFARIRDLTEFHFYRIPSIAENFREGKKQL